MSATKEEAWKQQARNELARRRFDYFIPWLDTSFIMGWHQRLMAKRLQRFYEQMQNKESPRLMIFLPPRNSKSLTCSQYFPLFALGQDPTLEVVLASYAASLPEKFSRVIRDTLRYNQEYSQLFPDTQLHPDVQNISEWHTTMGGSTKSVGRNGGLTGSGANCLIIDDIFASSQEVDSASVRDGAYDWYQSVAYTRLLPVNGVLHITTRWSEDDLVGKLLRLQDETEDEYADKWEVISLPAIADQDEYISEDGMFISSEEKEGYSLIRMRGQPLQPARYDIKSLNRIKASLSPRQWSALYQQNPIPEEGAYFSLEDLRYGPSPLIHDTNVFMAADTAASTSESANESCIVVGAYDFNRNLWILDMVVGKMNTYAFCDALLDLYVKFPSVLSVGIESGPISLALMPLLEQRMLERKVFLPLKDAKFMRPSQSKEIRARPIQGIMQQNKLMFPPTASWKDKALSQLKNFPLSEADDIIDALAWLGRMVLDVGPPKIQTGKVKPLISWKTRLARMGRGKKYLEA